jgi:hypothetical protein
VLRHAAPLLRCCMGMFEPEPHQGDRWKWGALIAVLLAVSAVLDSKALWPVTRFVFILGGAVVVVAGIAALVRLLR